MIVFSIVSIEFTKRTRLLHDNFHFCDASANGKIHKIDVRRSAHMDLEQFSSLGKPNKTIGIM